MTDEQRERKRARDRAYAKRRRLSGKGAEADARYAHSEKGRETRRKANANRIFVGGMYVGYLGQFLDDKGRAV